MTSLDAISVYRHSSDGSIGSSLTAPNSGGRPPRSSRGTACVSTENGSLVLAGGCIVLGLIFSFTLEGEVGLTPRRRMGRSNVHVAP